MSHLRQVKWNAPRGDKFKQNDASVTQAIYSNELGQSVREQGLDIFGWVSSLLINNPLSCLSGFGFVGQGFDRA
jgi:hypothetical protein